MTYHASVVNKTSLRDWRLGRVRSQLAHAGYDAVLLYDPINIRYATDTVNMQVWTLHNRVRYAFVALNGPVVLFDFAGCEHLSEGNRHVDEIRTARSATYLMCASDLASDTEAWATEVKDLMKVSGGHRLALDVCDPHMVGALQAEGLVVGNGTEVMERARWIKNADEIFAMKEAIYACEQGIASMAAHLVPGVTETELWSHLHQVNIALGGEWIESRLLTSGVRTKPWFQEASTRPIASGELVSFDTDLIGPNGYCADISRSWLCGDAEPTAEQRYIYRVAYDQLQNNIELMRPGLTLAEISRNAYRLPDDCSATNYAMLAHGVGLCDEAPLIPHRWNVRDTGRDDIVVEPGMVLCVESLVARNDGTECVKLEEQLLITETGRELLSSYPFESKLLS